MEIESPFYEARMFVDEIPLGLARLKPESFEHLLGRTPSRPLQLARIAMPLTSDSTA
jgi:hypothetical protein